MQWYCHACLHAGDKDSWNNLKTKFKLFNFLIFPIVCIPLCTLKSDNKLCYSTFDYYLFGTYAFGFPFCAYQIVQIYIKDEARQDADKIKERRHRPFQRSNNRTLPRSRQHANNGTKLTAYQTTK